MKQLSLWVSTFIITMTTLTACEPEAPKQNTKNVFSHQIDALDKAKELEKQLIESADKQRKAIEDMTK